MRIFGAMIVASLLSIASTAAAETASGEIQIVNNMASTIDTGAFEVTIMISELGQEAHGDGYHTFTYKNHSFNEAKVTAKLDDKIDGVTLVADVSLTGGNN